MKSKILLFSFLLLSLSSAICQNTGNLTIYSNTGKKFFVILNGVRQNLVAETNVNITGLTEEWYKCRILAEDKSFSIEKNVGVKMNTIVTYQITGKKSKYKLRYFMETPMGGAPAPDQLNVEYHDTEQPANTVNSNGSGNVNGTTTMNSNGSGTVSNGTTTQSNGNGTGTVNATTTTNGSTNGTTTNGTTTTTTTTQTNAGQPNGGNGSVAIGINMNENGGTITTGGQNGTEIFNIDMNVNPNGMGTTIQTNDGGTITVYEETTTTTTTSTSTTVNGVTTTSEQTTVSTSVNGNGTTTTTTTSGSVQNDIQPIQPVTTIDNTSFQSGDCLVTDAEMMSFTTAIENEDFNDDKIRIVNQMAQTKCMSVAQIQEIATLLSFSEDQMTFVKAAYVNCINTADYKQLSNVFDFSTDKQELQDFINSH